MHFPQKFCPWWTFFYFGFWFHGDLAFTHLHMESLWVFGTLLLMFEFSFISGLSHFRNDRPSGYPFVFSPHLFAFSVFTACDAFRFSISAFSVFTLESEVHTLFYIFLYIFSFSFPGLLFSFLFFRHLLYIVYMGKEQPSNLMTVPPHSSRLLFWFLCFWATQCDLGRPTHLAAAPLCAFVWLPSFSLAPLLPPSPLLASLFAASYFPFWLFSVCQKFWFLIRFLGRKPSSCSYFWLGDPKV